MRVYHYLEAKWALDDVARRRLKLSKIDDMNDPFEFRCVCSTDPRSQSALEKTRRETVERYGVLCFSRLWDSILMWSHYGDRHKGLCLGFDVPDDIARPAEYLGAPQITGNLISPESANDWMEAGTDIVNRLLEGKYDGWSYEKEVRVHGRREEIDEESGKYFVAFSERLILKEIIAGARFSLGRKGIEDALAGYDQAVAIAKLRCSTERFEIVIDERGFDGST